MIKALFFDIDGTLVSFQTHEIPTSTLRAIRAARAKGIHIFISTGRPATIINNLAPLQEEGLIDGYITMNGAYCFVGDEVIYKSAIPPEEVDIIMDYCTRRQAACIVVGEHSYCACGLNEQIRTIFHEHLKVTHPIPDTPVDEATKGKEVFMLTPFIDREQEAEVARHLQHCEVGRWHPAFADITARGNTKQKGMDEIIRHFQLRLEETMSFGDGGNDVPMLLHAGIGVAMGNASDDVKQHADYITESVDEDGILKALLHFNILTPADL
ncbi:MAG: Cof-type HAD-IIB family hydrolase [Bacteroides sp.]|nr:Cof-type HAD-IIB family hydrolase [Bacteroides sp.]